MSWSFTAAALAAGLLCVPCPASAQAFLAGGPLPVGRQDYLLPNPLAGTALLRVTLYYPALAAGTGTAPDLAHGPYPLVLFGHGLGNSPVPYAALLEHFASWGFVVAAPDTATWGPQALLAQDLVGSRAALQALAAQPASAIAGLLEPGVVGATGHSMGGGAALMSAMLDPSIDAVLALSPWIGPPGSVPGPEQAAAQLHVPLSIIVGAADDITPAATDSAPLYAAATGVLPLRALSVVAGAGHNDPALLIQAGNDGTAFLHAYLRDDAPALDEVYGPTAQADPACALQFDVTAPDCFVTGKPAPGQSIAVHVSGAPGKLLFGLLAPTAGGSTPAVPGLQLPAASLVLLGQGVAGSSQLLTLPIALPGDFQGLSQLQWFLQGLSVSSTGAVACSPLRTLVLHP